MQYLSGVVRWLQSKNINIRKCSYKRKVLGAWFYTYTNTLGRPVDVPIENDEVYVSDASMTTVAAKIGAAMGKVLSVCGLPDWGRVLQQNAVSAAVSRSSMRYLTLH